MNSLPLLAIPGYQRAPVIVPSVTEESNWIREIQTETAGSS